MYYNIQTFTDYYPEGLKSNIQLSITSNNLNKLYILLPIAAYSNIFHHSIPALIRPIQNKEYTVYIFTGTICACFLFYVLIGTVVSSYFGEHSHVASNLNWATYVGVVNGDNIQVPLYARVISWFIVLFPALDVASAFPLNAIILGNNLMSFYFTDSYHSHPVDHYWYPYIKKIFRLLAAVPPLLGAASINDLGKITDYTGITGFAIAFIFPSLLAIYSEELCKRLNLSYTTPYSHVLTSRPMQYASLGLGVFLIVYDLYYLLCPPTKGVYQTE
jgi:hypothetical protein